MEELNFACRLRKSRVAEADELGGNINDPEDDGGGLDDFIS